MAVTLEIYTITGGELIKAFYNAMAAMFQSSGILGLFKTAILIGGSWTVGQFLVKRDLRHMGLFLLKYVFVIAFILTPKCNVQIQDRTDPLRELSVSNVPLILGVIGAISSQISDRLTQTFELFFHTPNDFDYSQTGMILGAKIFLSASNIKITDASFNANMQKFMQQCVFYDLMYERYTLKDLNTATDIWGLVRTNASVARGFIYDGQYKSCLEAANSLDGAWENVISDAKSKYAGFAFGNHTEALANFEKYLPQSYQHLTTMAGDASTIIKQNMMANAIRDGVFSMGSRLNSKSAIESFSASRAQEKIPAALTNMGLMSAYWLPVLQSSIFCIVIGCFIFLLFFLPFPAGLSFLQFYITLYVWLALWAPIFTVINYILTAAASFSLSFAGAGVTTLTYQTGINTVYEIMAAVGGYLALASITISYMLLSRHVGSLISAVQQTGGVVQHGASSAAEEVQTGNYNYGNTSLANHSAFNSNAFHQDSNARISVGNVETTLDGGSIARIARNDSQTLTMNTATSHTPLAIQLGESTRQAFSKLSDNAMQSALHKSQVSSEQYGASLRSLSELSDSKSHGEQSGEGHQISNSAGFNTAVSKVSNLVDSFAHDHNISRDDAIRYLSASSLSVGASAGVGANFFGFVRGGVNASVNQRFERDSSATNHDAKLMNEAERFSQEHHFNDVVNEARQATKDTNFRTFDDRSGRLADNFSAGYDKSMHYRDESVASFNESETYHKQASISNEQVASINLDAQSGFVDWLSHHRAPNSQGNIGLQQAEWLIRQDPALAQAYARQYVQEKTAQSTSQFNKQHHINSHQIEQAYVGFQEHISGNTGVDNTLAGYKQTLQQESEKINVGQINNNAIKQVEKDFQKSGQDIRHQVGDMMESGGKLMQDVKISQADKDVK
jgi:conjugal transfer mating pair stabilization protein TraG